MGLFKTKKVSLSSIGDSSFLAPPTDEEFSRLYALITDGGLQLYFGKIPVALVRPFAPDFKPGEDPLASKIVTQLAAMIRKALDEGESPPNVWVYPGEACYVLSDDYVSYVAYTSLGVEHLPCLIMGEPTVPGPIEMMGPAPIDFVNRVTGRA